jgi:hypothetical protein
MKKNKLLDKFNEFEVEIPMLIDDLAVSLSSSKGFKNQNLNYELSTVDIVEIFYLDIINGNEKVNFSRNHLDRIIIAYLGEALIHHAGGRWEMGEDDDLTYGTPMIYGFNDDHDNIGFSPVGIRERFIKEKKNGIFRKSLEYCINKKHIEADLMAQMMNLSKKKN